jgi:predicted Fe-Mo cluster-binding NifX family protein
MNVAVPLFGSRISPRFDFCEEILIVTIEEGRIIHRKTLSISSLPPHQRIAELCKLDVKALICGGINHMFCARLRSSGISVISDVMGEADEALNRYLAGQLQPWAFCENRRKRVCKKRGGHGERFSPFADARRGSNEKEEGNE